MMNKLKRSPTHQYGGKQNSFFENQSAATATVFQVIILIPELLMESCWDLLGAKSQKRFFLRNYNPFLNNL